VKNLLFFILIILCFSCEQRYEDDDYNEDDVFIHHQIIITNPENLSGSFFLYSNAGHQHNIAPTETMEIVNGTFGTDLKNWDINSLNYIVMFYYAGGMGFGCINVEINTFKDFELYHTNNFIVGESVNNSFCAWNENSFQYEVVIND